MNHNLRCCCAVLLALMSGAGIHAAELDGLPVKGTPDKPLIVLEAEPAAASQQNPALWVYGGEVVAKEGADYANANDKQVTVGHKGLAVWGASFRYQLNPPVQPGDYAFWARWMQGGDPGFCPQDFQVWAGPDAEHLEQRGAFRMPHDDAWKFQWVGAGKTIPLKADDIVIEVRNTGRAQDAKAFDAFVLSPGNPPPPTPAPKKVGEIKVTGANEARTDIGELPTEAAQGKPQILLELGSGAPMKSTEDLAVYGGGVGEHEGDRGIEVNKDEVTSLRSGQGLWAVNFQFKLPVGHPSGDYIFWARWKQGGDPKTSAQTFEVWAGADVSKLEKRAEMTLAPSGWSYAWRDGKTVAIKPEDTVLEVRNRGNGQSGKIFSAFLLGGAKPPPPPVELPITGTADKPVVALGFGKAPLNRAVPNPAVLVYSGKVVDKSEAIYATVGGDTATVAHKGFGEFGATFQFDLTQPIPAGDYNFSARYMSGGEPSQVRQTFTVKAGPDEQHLGIRGTFQTVNNTPFKQQWLAGKGTLAIFPGDKFVQIVNTGKAHDAKVFSGFVLGLEKPMAAWLTGERAMARSEFLALLKKVEKPEKWLYMLDGEGEGDAVLFKGLSQESVKPWYDAAQVNYLLGEDADKMAKSLNLPALPAAVVVNADRKVLGVLSNPKDVAQVASFLASPGSVGVIPSPAQPKAVEPSALAQDGSPVRWLTGMNWPGQNGVGRWGIGAEATQRPNPGDLIACGYYTAGNQKGSWEEHPSGANGVCVLTDKLADSYAWGKATNYAVVYLRADAPVKTVLHLQHSGIKSAIYLDGSELPLVEDKEPPFTLGRQQPAAKEAVVERAGQEIHDDVTVPQSAQPPVEVALDLAKGWHCLIIKLVHGQNKGERMLFAAKFAGLGGRAPSGLFTQTSDPEVVSSIAQAAAGLWPSLTLEGIPGNLPHPGEPLTLVADMRVTPSFMAKWCPDVFLPINATLRVRMADYDGKVIKTVETKGSFPDVAKLNLGPAPEPGFYVLTPELVAPDGRLIHRFFPDGFSVVLGNASQKERVDKKKLMNSYYYAFNDWDTLAPWLERIGMLKNVGSTPGLTGTDIPAKWEDAKKRGIVLFGDFAGDSAWMNNDVKNAEGMVALASKYTRYFKGINEVDGRSSGENGMSWQISRKPEKYVERTQAQYEAVHKARTDAINFGGSVYCSGVSRVRSDHLEILGPREWLRKCLELGLDKYIDAWDVHAYPQLAPHLEAASVSNSPTESDLGVREVYKEAGIPFNKPFLLGETSAMVFHGFTALRWQADTVAKMTAWVNSRPDWMGVALCAAQHDRRKTAEEYGMARNPGEASIYTAGALIDGLPYKRVKTEDNQIQAAWFGGTFMVWRADEKSSDWKMKLEGAGPWVMVDVVGRVRPLDVRNGEVQFAIGTSPLYVLTKTDYQRLTR